MSDDDSVNIAKLQVERHTHANKLQEHAGKLQEHAGKLQELEVRSSTTERDMGT